MKKSKKWTILAAALALSALCGGVALAAGGDQNDPLITLSYLEQTFLPQVTAKVEEQVASKQEELKTQLGGQIARYKQEMEEQLGASSAAEDSASFVLVTLSKNQVLTMELGCEVMLRVGTAKVDASENPALLDISTGAALNRGSSLTKNHLYMATIKNRKVTATADTVKLLVRGGYTVG